MASGLLVLAGQLGRLSRFSTLSALSTLSTLPRQSTLCSLSTLSTVSRVSTMRSQFSQYSLCRACSMCTVSGVSAAGGGGVSLPVSFPRRTRPLRKAIGKIKKGAGQERVKHPPFLDIVVPATNAQPAPPLGPALTQVAHCSLPPFHSFLACFCSCFFLLLDVH